MSYSGGTVCGCDPNAHECCDICQCVDGTETDTQDIVANPKDVIGSDKLPVHLFSAAGIAMGALGKLDGCLKYGRNNFRAAKIRYTIYLDALKRHIDALQEGENDDPESGLHHLCHILATADILADALAGETLIDDRNYGGTYWRGFLTKITPHVKRLKEKHADKNPKHWTVQDNEPVKEEVPKTLKFKDIEITFDGHGGFKHTKDTVYCYKMQDGSNFVGTQAEMQTEAMRILQAAIKDKE